jgi:hypothetical protein
LVILDASPLHRASIKRSEKGKAKAKVDWVDVTSDEEEEEEKEEEEEEEEEEELQNEQNEQGHEEEEDNDDQENEDDGKKNNGRNKGQPVVIKYGPPQGKQKKNPPSAQQTTNPAVAGPSTILPLKHVLKTSKAPKPAQSQAPSIKKTTSHLLSVSRLSKTKNSVALTGPVSSQVLF